MQSTKLDRALNAFRDVYDANVTKAVLEVPLSTLSPERQADYWRREKELHPSSFPFCGLRYAYQRLLVGLAKDPIIDDDFGRDYFLPVGTATHTALQRWMGYSGQILGDWQCLSCKKTYKFRTRPSKCRCGHPHLEYHELGGKWGKNISWHTDGVFEKAPGQYWVLDYKTTSEYALQEHKKTKSVFPYMTNRFQIETYIPLIEDTYKIKLQGWLLAYVPRDNPKYAWKAALVGGTINDERREELMTRLQQADADFGVARRVIEQPVKVFKRLIATKLCPDRDFYKHFVKDQYSPCPLSKVCFNAKKLQARLMETIEAAAEEK